MFIVIPEKIQNTSKDSLLEIYFSSYKKLLKEKYNGKILHIKKWDKGMNNFLFRKFPGKIQNNLYEYRMKKSELIELLYLNEFKKNKENFLNNISDSFELELLFLNQKNKSSNWEAID